MVKFKKIKKKRVFFLLLLSVAIFYGIFWSKSYEIEYTLGDVHILEKFNKQEKTYSFHFQTKEKEFFLIHPYKYIHSKKLIKKVEINEKEDTICLIPIADKFNLYPLCIKNEKLISYHLIEDEELIPFSYKKEIIYEEKNYKSIKWYSLNNKKYYIWNYSGFDVISETEQKEIKLFKEDIYNVPLAIKVNNDLLIADYDNKYNFTKFYVIDSQKNKVRELLLDKEISFDSYFLGTIGKKAYLVDKKNKKEYEIYPKRLLIENIAYKNQGKIFHYGIWEPISIQSLISNENQFIYKELIQFKIDNNTLYKIEESYQTKVSKQNVKDIIYIEGDTVYYLVNEKLYYYNDTDGEVLVLSNFEWNFNYKNMIYIF